MCNHSCISIVYCREMRVLWGEFNVKMKHFKTYNYPLCNGHRHEIDTRFLPFCNIHTISLYSKYSYTVNYLFTELVLAKKL